jgi:hypothetical protein
VLRRRLRLPLRLNGAGLIDVDSICAAAFVGSVVAPCEADEVLARNIGGIERFAQPARLLLQARLAPLGATKTRTAQACHSAATWTFSTLLATWSKMLINNQLLNCSRSGLKRSMPPRRAR